MGGLKVIEIEIQLVKNGGYIVQAKGYRVSEECVDESRLFQESSAHSNKKEILERIEKLLEKEV